MNKVNTKAEVRFTIDEVRALRPVLGAPCVPRVRVLPLLTRLLAQANWLADDAKQRLRDLYPNRITRSGELVVTSQKGRRCVVAAVYPTWQTRLLRIYLPYGRASRGTRLLMRAPASRGAQSALQLRGCLPQDEQDGVRRMQGAQAAQVADGAVCGDQAKASGGQKAQVSGQGQPHSQQDARQVLISAGTTARRSCVVVGGGSTYTQPPGRPSC